MPYALCPLSASAASRGATTRFQFGMNQWDKTWAGFALHIPAYHIYSLAQLILSLASEHLNSQLHIASPLVHGTRCVDVNPDVMM